MWLYKNEQINNIDDILKINEKAIGFIYVIENETNDKFYIGKKSIYSTTTKNLGKKELSLITDKRKSTKKKITKESNWFNYCGSNKYLIEDIKNGDNITKEILYFCTTKKQLTYWEMYYQILYNVLEGTSSYNDNILGKFYKKDL